MKFFDLHCDTVMGLTEGKSLLRNDLHIDLEKLSRGGSLAQCFAIFIEQEECRKNGIAPYDYYCKALEIFRKALQENASRITQAYSAADVLENERKGLLSAILTVEGGEALGGDLSRLKTLWDDGVRMMTLTWNYENEIGFSHVTGGGLKPFGKECVEEMAALGMKIDVSHLSDEGFYDVIALTGKKAPVVASHSCARALNPSCTRDMTDDMMKKLAETGGIIGINFYSRFLREGADHALMEDVRLHAEHMVNCAGIEGVALGSDFDGISCTLEWKDYSGMPALLEYLHRSFTWDQLEKICRGNALRVFG